MKIKAKIRLKNTNEGGRDNPIASGYRPILRYKENENSDCEIIVNRNPVNPGESGEVDIKILHPKNIEGIKKGDAFTLTEALKEVGTGEVLEIFSNEFKIGDIVLFGSDEVEILEFQKVFGIEKAKIRNLKTNKIQETKLDQLKELVEIYTNAKIRFLSIAAKIKEEIAKQSMLAPIESNIIPLPHQILALEKVMSSQYLRFLLADEVGMGKTIEAGLILKELKLRGIVKRTLIVVPKSAMGQWAQEMKKHFNETFYIYDTEYINTISRTFSRLDFEKEINLFNQREQIIVSMDSLKPIDTRQGWTQEKVDAHNRFRIHSVLQSEFDLLMIDECHKVGGSHNLVSRYKMADTLCNAIPNVLLLSATPHRGKSDHFRRILQLLNSDAFAGEGMPSIKELEPYVIRTEKRSAIDYDGKPLFNKRLTQRIIVEYDVTKQSKQQKLYVNVTNYVVDGFNISKKTKNNSYGFVMLLFQRLMSSSTQAILDAMQKRANRLSSERTEVNKESVVSDVEELMYEGQLEIDFEQKIFSLIEATQANYDAELGILQGLIVEAKECLNYETDAKIDFLISKLTELKQKENNPDLKFLIFTEFTSTQSMLKKILEQKGGYICEAINGSMEFDDRVNALKKFKESSQILICTDAAGESLNMQFAHIVINYDMPWNPMVVEQRIGRVDRIGQEHEVLALNMMLDNSVDKRVYEVIEIKLNQILNELGIDKTADVLDSTLERKQVKDLYLTSLLDPGNFEVESEEWLSKIKNKLSDYKTTEGAMPTVSPKDIKAQNIDAIKHSPLPKWLENLTRNYLQTKNIPYEKIDGELKFKFPGLKENIYTFNIRESINNPIPEPISFQHEIIQTILKNAIPFTDSQLIPLLKLHQNNSTPGIWALWLLEVKNQFITNQIVQPIFVSNEKNDFPLLAQSIWDKFIQENKFFDCMGVLRIDDSKFYYEHVYRKAEEFLSGKFREFEQDISQKTYKIRENKYKSFAFQENQMKRIGIENIKQSRLNRLQKEKEIWESTFESSGQIVPSLTCLLMVNILNE